MQVAQFKNVVHIDVHLVVLLKRLFTLPINCKVGELKHIQTILWKYSIFIKLQIYVFKLKNVTRILNLKLFTHFPVRGKRS